MVRGAPGGAGALRCTMFLLFISRYTATCLSQAEAADALARRAEAEARYAEALEALHSRQHTGGMQARLCWLHCENTPNLGCWPLATRLLACFAAAPGTAGGGANALSCLLCSGCGARPGHAHCLITSWPALVPAIRICRRTRRTPWQPRWTPSFRSCSPRCRRSATAWPPCRCVPVCVGQ